MASSVAGASAAQRYRPCRPRSTATPAGIGIPNRKKPVFITHASGEYMYCPNSVEGPWTPRLLMKWYV